MKISKLCVSYGDKKVLQDFSAEFGNGITLLTGPSGFGKTTLLHTIAGLIEPDSGEIIGRPERISLMFQDDRLLPWLTALQNIEIVCDDREKAMHYLRAVELEAEAGTRPAALSGGMRRDKIALIEKATVNGWLSFYPLHEDDLPASIPPDGRSVSHAEVAQW